MVKLLCVSKDKSFFSLLTVHYATANSIFSAQRAAKRLFHLILFIQMNDIAEKCDEVLATNLKPIIQYSSRLSVKL